MVRWWRKKTAAADPAPRSRWSKFARLVVRGVLASIMWLFVLVALLVAGLSASDGLREKLLDVGLDVAARYIPGTVAMEAAAWPELGHLQLTDVVWTHVVLPDGDSPPDTLVHLARLDLRVDLEALRHRDVVVDSLFVAATQLDGPAIEQLLTSLVDSEPDSQAVVADVDSTGPASFPRPGAIPGLPSVGLAHWRLELAAAILTPDMSLNDLVITGALEARHGHQARAVIEHLEMDFSTTAFDTLTRQPWTVSLQHLGLGLTLEAALDSTAEGEVIAAVMDSLSVHFDGMGDAHADSSHNWWQSTGPVRLTNSAHVSRVGAGYQGHFKSDFVLPGALELKALLPDEFPHESFGQIVGSLALDGEYVAPRLNISLALDLEPTSWLDSGLLKGQLDSDLDEIATTGLSAVSAELDTLDFALLGAVVRAGGALHKGAVDLNLYAAVTDTQLAVMFLPEATAGTEALFDLDAKLGGTLQQPTLMADLHGGLATPRITVPELNLQVDGGGDGGELVLSLPLGLATADAGLDSLHTRLHVDRDEENMLSGQFTFDAWRGADRLALGGQAWVDSLGLALHKKVQLDSLVVVGMGQDVRLQQAAVLELGPGAWDVKLSPLVFSGEPGEINIGGQADGQSLDLASQVALYLPEELLTVLAPIEFWSDDGGRDVSLDAKVELGGTRTEPTLLGSLEARLIPHRDEPSIGLDIDLALAAGDSAGVTAEMALVTADSTLLRGRVLVPGLLDPETGAWRHTPGQPARLVVPEQSLGLTRVNRVLPPEVSVEGGLSVALDVSVPLDEAPSDSSGLSGSVEGFIKAPELAVRLPNRSRLDTDLDLTITGSLGDPVLGGRITIKSGFFRLPELPRSLLPSEGEPLLWALADSLAETPDSLQVFVQPELRGPEMAAGGPGFLPEMDLQILLPGNLRIHGYGLDIELAGDLKVGRAFDEDDRPQPQIHGLVHTVHGTLQFMNRVFKVERGEVRFVGAVPADPVLDMMLETNVSGTLIRILVTGSASDPVIELTSEPDYQEQDIMAVLLFGRPLSDLDNDQRGGVNDGSSAGEELRQNLAGLAMAFGTAGLQNTVSNSLGVDMVEVGSGSEGDSTLMVGKFINPKLMLKYNVSLEKSGTYFLTMEYTLTRIFKVVTTYGQGEEDSGLELKWTRRY